MKNSLVISIIACVIAVVAMVVALLPNNGKDGINGVDGKDGVTPTIEISDDGYWVINGEKTDVKASPEETVDENPQGLQFYLQDDGTYVVSCGNAKYLSNIVIPEIYKGGKVVGVVVSAFSRYVSLKSITISDSVTSIGDDAFAYCPSLTSVTIGDSVTSIGGNAFNGCGRLTSINIPDSVTSIGNFAFYSCPSLTSISFDGTIEQWNAIEFGDCWNGLAPATEVVCSDGTVPLN